MRRPICTTTGHPGTYFVDAGSEDYYPRDRWKAINPERNIYFKFFSINIALNVTSADWATMPAGEAAVLKDIKRMRTLETEGPETENRIFDFAQNILTSQFYNKSTVSTSRRHCVLPFWTLRIVMFAAHFYAPRFGNHGRICKPLELMTLANYKRLSLMDLGLVCLALFQNAARVDDLGFTDHLLTTLIANIHLTDSHHVPFVTEYHTIILGCIMKQLANSGHILWSLRMELMRKWISLDARRCANKRCGVLWRRFCRLPGHRMGLINFHLPEFSAGVREFLDNALSYQIESNRCRGENKKSEVPGSNPGGSLKIIYPLQLKDVDQCLIHLRRNRIGLAFLETNKIAFLDRIVDFLLIPRELPNLDRYPQYLFSILQSMAFVDYYPKVLYEIAMDEYHLGKFLVTVAWSKRMSVFPIYFLEHCLRVERPSYPRFAPELIHEVSRRLSTPVELGFSEALLLQPLADFKKVVLDVAHVLQCATTDFISDLHFSAFPFREIVVSFRDGRVWPANVDEIPMSSVVSESVSDEGYCSEGGSDSRWLVITVFGSKHRLRNEESGFYITKVRQLEKLGIMTHFLVPYSVESQSKQREKLREFIRQNNLIFNYGDV